MKNTNIGKTIFVLLIALVFFGSIIYMGVKDTKIIKNEQEKNFVEWKNEEISENNTDIKQTYEEEPERTEEKIKKEDEVLGTLKIPAINVEAKVKQGSSEEILENYVGHIEETSTFDGNVGLAAHNRGEKNNYFENLDKLKIGDEIFYKVGEKARKYKVFKINEILDTDWNEFENTKNNELTLITCVNNKVNVRLCVKAKEIQ